MLSVVFWPFAKKKNRLTETVCEICSTIGFLLQLFNTQERAETCKTACASMIIIIIAKKRADFLTNESESEAKERNKIR